MIDRLVMQAQDHVEFFVVLFVLIAIWIKVSIGESRKEKEAIEKSNQKRNEESRKQQEAIEADMQLVKSAFNDLPDIDSAFSKLRNRYKWADIAATVDIYSNELKLLLAIPSGKPERIVLPNLRSKEYNSDEWRVLSGIKDVTSLIHGVEAYGEEFHTEELSHEMKNELLMFYGDENYAKEPTAKNMFSLVDMGFVVLHKSVGETDRKFLCSLSEKGKAFIDLNHKFSMEHMDRNSFKSSPSREAGYEIAKTISLAIEILVGQNLVGDRKASAFQS